MKFVSALALVLLLTVCTLVPAKEAATTTTSPPTMITASGLAVRSVRTPETGAQATTAPVAQAQAPDAQTEADTKATPKPLTMNELDKVILTENRPADLSKYFCLIYTGTRHADLEPCGCVTHKLGGIDREARLIKRITELGVPELRCDAGGFLRNIDREPHITKAKYLLRAMKELDYNVLNVSCDELVGGLRFVRELQTSYSLPMISANIIDTNTTATVFPPYKVSSIKLKSGETLRVGFLGITQTGTVPPSAHVAITSETEAVNKYLPEMRKECDLVVLLAYETKEKLVPFLHTLGPNSGIDIAVAGAFSTLSGNVIDVNGTRVVSPGYEGRYVGSMFIETEKKKILNARNQVLEVTQDIPPIPEITQILNEYKEVFKSTLKSSSMPGTAPSPTISFSGAGACEPCHKKEFVQWKSTRHQQAMTVLVQKNQQFNPNCLKCHVTGYQVDNGFTDFVNSPQFGGVQCEVCHGPGFDHVVQKRKELIAKQMSRPVPKPDPKARVKMQTKMDQVLCTSCHDEANDKHFDFKRDIRLVNHSRTEQRPASAPVTRDSSATAARDTK